MSTQPNADISHWRTEVRPSRYQGVAKGSAVGQGR